jgi:hypothetical protein
VHVIEEVEGAVRAAPQEPALHLQAVASTLPAGESALVPHDWHPVVMVANLYVPTAQFGQEEVVPVVVDHVPAAQLSQLSDPEEVQVPRNLPAPHNCRGSSGDSKCRSGVSGTGVHQAHSKRKEGRVEAHHRASHRTSCRISEDCAP